MRKIVYGLLAAVSFLTVSTNAAAAPVATPLTQPAPETVSGDDAFLGLPLLALIAVAGAAAAAAVAVAVSNDDSPTSP